VIAALIPLLHLLAAAVCGVSGRWARWIAAASWAGSAGLIGLLAAEVVAAGQVHYTLGGWPDRWGIELIADEPAIALLALLGLLHGCVHAFEWSRRREASFYVLLQVLVGAAAAITVSHDLFNIYVLLELMTLTSYLLVGFERRPAQLWASLKYLLLASFGMGLFLLGGAVVYEHAGTMNLCEVGAVVRAAGDAPWVRLAGALLLTGVGVKSGIFVLSLWLPSAHASAPLAISALLSGVVVKMSVLEVLRLGAVFPLSTAIWALGAITGVLGAVYALFERDIKRMLAYSTLSQIGYALLALAGGSPAAAIAAIAYLVAHGLFKALLFLGTGLAARHAGGAHIGRLLAKRDALPRTAVLALFIGTLGIIGWPPLDGFWAKELISACCDSVATRVMLWVIPLGTAAAFAKLLPLFVVRRRDPDARGRITVHRGEMAAIAVLIAGVVFFGWSTPWWISGLQLSAEKLLLDAGRAVLIAGAGWLTYALVKKRWVALPRTIFSTEEGVLAVLLVFLGVWLMVGGGG
jgi:multicomponent Na+:H+ antiporter subunit D